MSAVASWRARYEELGFSVTPIKGGAKGPPLSSWRDDANLGLDPTGLALCLDCDDVKTVSAVRAGLAGLGISPIRSQTASGKSHFWVRAIPPARFNYANLAVGPGELRARNCYVLEEPSFTGDGDYRWIDPPEELSWTPVVEWRDLHWLLPAQDSRVDSTDPAMPLPRIPAPERAILLLSACAVTLKGRPVFGYPTRSEAEAAAVALLYLAGWSLPEVTALFEKSQPGKFREQGRSRFAYLDKTWREVAGFIAAHPVRRRIAAEYTRTLAESWPGRNGQLDRGVYLGLLSWAWHAAKLDVSPGQRNLAALCPSRHYTVSAALRRLCLRGKLLHVGIQSELSPIIGRLCLLVPNPPLYDSMAFIGRNSTIREIKLCCPLYPVNDTASCSRMGR